LYELVRAHTSPKSGKSRQVRKGPRRFPNSFSGGMKHKKIHIFFKKLTSKKANGYFPDVIAVFKKVGRGADFEKLCKISHRKSSIFWLL
jgi:hypothetical protein